MKKGIKVALLVLGGGFAAFLTLFGVYFFNLDMKFTAYIVDPLLQKLYNKRKPNYYI